MHKKIGVGIIGVTPGRSWAANAHIPALRSLDDDFDIVALSNTRQDSAVAAAQFYGVPDAFSSVEALVACPGVDLVAVTVKVPHHLALVRTALAAGKHVYCEWPLGNGLAEAREMAALADAAGTVAVCGMQARFSPALIHVGNLIRQGYVGDILSVSVIGSGMVWGPVMDTPNAYCCDINNGATMLSIPLGHTMDGLAHILGEITDIGAQLSRRRSVSINNQTGEPIPMTAHDQVLFHARIGGAPLSVHYRGGMPRGTGLLIEINGTKGDLQIIGSNGHAQLADLDIRGATGEGTDMAPIVVPADCSAGLSPSGTPGNIARFYQHIARQIRTGTSDCPDFKAAVKRHQMLAAIEQSARTRKVVQPIDC
ncbi:Gfo/Idh/MocA family oxidoreductase [Aquisediminimonas sediminicola]|uniref:Gfo/Idh/MocA family oxidoreductase n=1 Tax=Alteraquisediminimonas sediminicola TaxID=2676787 RepID=UPI001C8E660B|nr:Gfo/Idh/MocA family oxidoreductase [Aquisediminimonas sediminicola]